MAANLWCGARLPGRATTWPRRTWWRRTPRSSSAALSPASARSIGLPNVSTPVTTAVSPVPSPTTSTVSPARTVPRSTAPVTTVPRPVIESTFSTGSRNGASVYRAGTGTCASTASSSAPMAAAQPGSPARIRSADTRITGAASPR